MIPTKIESVLLTNRFKMLENQYLSDLINDRFKDLGLRFELIAENKQAKISENVLLLGQDDYIMISQIGKPLSRDGFSKTLLSPFTQMTFKDASDKVFEHSGYYMISVSQGVPMPDLGGALGNLMAEVKGTNNPGILVKYCVYNHRVIKALIPQLLPSAVHWCQSNMMVRPSEYMQRYGSSDFPGGLLVHPSYFSSRKIVDGKQVIGMRTFGMSHFLGKEYLFPEEPVDPSWLHDFAAHILFESAKNKYVRPPFGQKLLAHDGTPFELIDQGPNEAFTKGFIEVKLLKKSGQARSNSILRPGKVFGRRKAGN